MSVIELPRNADGQRVAWDTDTGLVYLLSPCCGASGKGLSFPAPGVGCRACYARLPMVYGMAWDVDEYAESTWCPDCGDLLSWCPRSPLRGRVATQEG